MGIGFHEVHLCIHMAAVTDHIHTTGEHFPRVRSMGVMTGCAHHRRKWRMDVLDIRLVLYVSVTCETQFTDAGIEKPLFSG